MSGLPPLVMTAAGPVPQSPASLLAQLIALVAATNPDYTANLPGSLIDDVSGTDVGAMVLIDQARVELINSLTPFGANAFLLNQLGQVYGVPLGQGSNATVDVVFSGPVGFPIAKGFTVSDGTYQYIVQDGGIIGSDGSSDALSALAAVFGTWAIPAGSVNQIVTSVPTGYMVTVTNPQAGTPATSPQTEWDYRTQVLQAGLAASQGMARYLKTLLGNVPGVIQRLVSVRQQTNGGWEIIVGGGDNYQVALAVFQSLFDISTLTGSIMAITGITQANPGVVTTALNYGLATGTVINIAGVVGMTEVNNTPLTITAITDTTFSIGVDTAGYSAYVSGGVVTPNPRNVVVAIDDYPDTYDVPLVRPPAQTVTVTLTWNTTATNFTGATAFAAAAQTAIANYVNSIPVGAPINLFEMQNAVQAATTSILATPLLTRMVFAVSINGVGVSPVSGTEIISADPESYFSCAVDGVTVNQG